MSQWIPKNQCPSCLSKNVISEAVPGTSQWIYHIQCNDCMKLHEHNEGDKAGGGFDIVTEIVTKNMENNKMHADFEVSKEYIEQLKETGDEANGYKGQIFQQIAQAITEKLYPELVVKDTMDNVLCSIDYYLYTIEDLITLFEDFEKYPNKIADFKRILINQRDVDNS